MITTIFNTQGVTTRLLLIDCDEIVAIDLEGKRYLKSRRTGHWYNADNPLCFLGLSMREISIARWMQQGYQSHPFMRIVNAVPCKVEDLSYKSRAQITPLGLLKVGCL